MGTPKLNPHFQGFSKCLTAHEVRYLLIGGYAVGFHGWPRNTKHIDFWIAGDPENQARVIKALREFAFPDVQEDLLREESVIVRFGLPPHRIEILRRITGLEFEQAWRNRVQWTGDDFQIPVIGLADLRQNKAASGRSQDLADLEHLPDV
jgi:hypothetical protein